jgi:hypothetical protein
MDTCAWLGDGCAILQLDRIYAQLHIRERHLHLHCVRVAAARPVHRLSARVSSQELGTWPRVRATSLVALALAYPL